MNIFLSILLYTNFDNQVALYIESKLLVSSNFDLLRVTEILFMEFFSSNFATSIKIAHFFPC